MGELVVGKLMELASELMLMITTMAIAQIGWYLAAGVVIGILLVAILFWTVKATLKFTWWICALSFGWIRGKLKRAKD